MLEILSHDEVDKTFMSIIKTYSVKDWLEIYKFYWVVCVTDPIVYFVLLALIENFMYVRIIYSLPQFWLLNASRHSYRIW